MGFSRRKDFSATYIVSSRAKCRLRHTHMVRTRSTTWSMAEGCFKSETEEREWEEGEIAMAPSGQNHGVVNRSADRLVVLVYMAPKPHLQLTGI